MITEVFRHRKALITGHTGFKGSWLSLWLHKLGAEVTGIALDPKSPLDAYYALGINKITNDLRHDITEIEGLRKIVLRACPDIVFHLAAQPLVLESYNNPLLTLKTNILGTANLLEVLRDAPSVKTVIVVTSDKCYENDSNGAPFRETDKLGGSDPYSASKAAAEIVTLAYRRSFFGLPQSPAVATVRAGNVIGGGDWADNRIVPDCIKALKKGNGIDLRNPLSLRPWQHVLDPLYGYLILAEKMLQQPSEFCGAWNFGPENKEDHTVGDLAEKIAGLWGSGTITERKENPVKHEANTLRLDISKARNSLGWKPALGFDKAVRMTVSWYKAQSQGEDMVRFSLNQIDEFENGIR